MSEYNDGATATPTLRSLGFTWQVRSNDPALVAHVARLYDACRSAAPPRHEFALLRHEHGRVSLLRDGHEVLHEVECGYAIAQLAWEVNEGARTTTSHLLLHASAVERDGRVIVFPALQGVGKSTLVAALARRGLRYVTDEVVAIDPRNRTVDPYPKPISLRPGSWALFPDLQPTLPPDFDGYPQWLIAPGAFGSDAVAPPGGRPDVIVFPERELAATSSLQSVPRAAALIELAQHTIRFATNDRSALGDLASVVARARCYRLPVDDLDRACEAVDGLVEGA
jgi:hypothetical protein